MNILIFGPPGSGKGTQSKNIAKHFGIQHISFGDVLRNHVANKTPIGLRVKEIIDKGELVGSELMKEILSDQIELAKKEKGVIFDGFPRSIEQAKLLDESFMKNNLSLFCGFYLVAPNECVLKRIQKRAEIERRKDDQDLSKIKNRLDIYHEETKPVISYYEKLGIDIHKIDSTRSIEEIFLEVKEKINLTI